MHSSSVIAFNANVIQVLTDVELLSSELKDMSLLLIMA